MFSGSPFNARWSCGAGLGRRSVIVDECGIFLVFFPFFSFFFSFSLSLFGFLYMDLEKGKKKCCIVVRSECFLALRDGGSFYSAVLFGGDLVVRCFSSTLSRSNFAKFAAA